MKITIDLDDFTHAECGLILNELRSSRIPHLLEDDEIVVDQSDEGAVNRILVKVRSTSLQLQTEDSPAAIDPPPENRPSIADYEKFLADMTSDSSQYLASNQIKRDDEPGGIATAGLLIGGGFGIFAVVAAFSDPNFEGRVYIFLPAIIFGVAGFAIGSAIENGIRKSRKKW